ncbi:APC family permease [Mycoplasma todarodis]|uniref:APC family permease n=1 Tax=Mycoplasma todarodis TaxID=1937191 RepID=UPI003B328BF3
MSIKQGKKLGFFTSLTMLIGTVVGIGIFFKNHSVKAATHGDGVSWLLAWIIGGIIAAATAISFSEIGTMKLKTKTTGLPGWSEKLFGKKFGKFTEFNFSFFYWGSLISVLGFFGSEMLIAMFGQMGVVNSIPIYGHVLIGLSFTITFLSINFISIKASGIFQQIATILKFIPLVFAFIVGIVLPMTNNIGGENMFHANRFTFQGLIVALPSVLFAYDAFMSVTTLTNKVEDGERKVPTIVLVGMILVIILYTLISISSIIHNSGSIQELIQNVLPKSSIKPIGVIIFGFIVISTWGVVNGVSAAMVSVFEENTVNDTFFGMSKLKESRVPNKFIPVIFIALTISFWTMVIGIPSIVINKDYLFNGFSNFPTLFFFIIYGMIILKYTIKRKEFNTKKINKYVYFIAAWIAIIGISIVVGYLLVEHFIINTIMHPKEFSSWAIQITEFIIFLVELFIFITFPMFNSLLKKYENRKKVSKTVEQE